MSGIALTKIPLPLLHYFFFAEKPETVAMCVQARAFSGLADVI